jgi:formate hydrogenlyase subunit 6/NADH:ubiquinone oxidoreductase subunit I
MARPAKMLQELLRSFTKKPATVKYPAEGKEMPKGFRGKLKFYPEKCVGCKLCMRDCPSGAIEIRKLNGKEFEAVIDLGKCIYCGQCVDSCLKKALEVTPEYELAQLDNTKLKVIFHALPKEGTKNTP